MKRVWIGLAVLLMAAGCGPKESSVGDADSGAQSVSVRDRVQGGRLQIAVIPKGLVHQFWLTVKAGAEAAGFENNAAILWRGPAQETNVSEQINIVEDMISRNVDAIVMAATDPVGMRSSVEKAAERGIPVVIIDSAVDSDAPISLVATDNEKGAMMAADELARLVDNRGTVGLVAFVPGAATSRLREEGFKKGIANYPDITLLPTVYSESDVARAMTLTEDMLQAHPELVGIFAANESSAMGAAQALRAAGKAGQVKLVAFDSAEEEIDALKEGVIHALIVQDPYKMGYEGVRAAIAHIKGEPVEERIDTGVTVVTADNLENVAVQELLYPEKRKPAGPQPAR